MGRHILYDAGNCGMRVVVKNTFLEVSALTADDHDDMDFQARRRMLKSCPASLGDGNALDSSDVIVKACGGCKEPYSLVCCDRRAMPRRPRWEPPSPSSEHMGVVLEDWANEDESCKCIEETATAPPSSSSTPSSVIEERGPYPEQAHMDRSKEDPTRSERRRMRRRSARAPAVAEADSMSYPAALETDARSGVLSECTRGQYGRDSHAECATRQRGSSDMHGCRRDTLFCHLHIDPQMLEHGFDVNKKIIGRGGTNTKSIFTNTGAKVRLRGRGSGFLERVGKTEVMREAPVPLMLTVSVEKYRNEGAEAKFQKAVEMAVKLLFDVSSRFRGFRKLSAGGAAEAEEPRFWIGNISPESQVCAAWQLRNVPAAAGNKPL